MALAHLTDDQLQDYLDGNLSSVSNTVGEHLEECQLCQEALEEYKRLYAGLKDHRGFELSPDFAKSVLSQLQREFVVKSRKQRYAGILWSLLGLALGICTTVYVIIWTKMDQEITGIATNQLKLLSASLDSTEKLLGKVNIDFSLLFFSGFALLVIRLADYVFSHKGEQSILFLNNT